MRNDCLGVVVALVVLTCGWTAALAQPVTRVSVGANGEPANHASSAPAISGDGRHVVFESSATNLVIGDTNNRSDIFVYDRKTRRTVRVSVAADGSQADDFSEHPGISGDGRFVAFDSRASNLVVGDTNGFDDVFVHDRDADGDGIYDEAGAISVTRVSVDSSGGQADLGYSLLPSISGDGRVVAFTSGAADLIAGDTNGFDDVLVHDLTSRATVRASVSSGGNQGNGGSTIGRLSDTGRYVVFFSFATNLVAGDTNAVADVFVRDLEAFTTVRASVGSTGDQANAQCALGDISADGRFVTFSSIADNLVANDTETADAFLRDLSLGITTRVSESSDGERGDGQTAAAAISDDGHAVVFDSRAGNLVADDANFHSDVFVRDLAALATERMSVDAHGAERFEHSGFGSSLSGDGRHVAFVSDCDLVPADTNGVGDIYVRDRIALTFNGVAQAGATVNFTVQHATQETGHLGLVFLSCSVPSEFPLPGGASVPLTFDACTALGLQLSAVLTATIDGTGTGSTPPIVFPAAPPGLVFYAAAATIDLGSGVFIGVTGPIQIVTQ